MSSVISNKLLCSTLRSKRFAFLLGICHRVRLYNRPRRRAEESLYVFRVKKRKKRLNDLTRK